MASYTAVVLVCAMSVPPQACNEKSAIDVLSIKVPSEIGCAMGWQEVIARSPLREDLGKTSYPKTVCRRTR